MATYSIISIAYIPLRRRAKFIELLLLSVDPHSGRRDRADFLPRDEFDPSTR